MRAVKKGHTESGIASWYGEPHHGRATASGEIYDMHRLTAAHRRLPFDTLARIEHSGSGRTVDVRINDRGPFVKGRFLDLSRAAAERLGMRQEGTARVKLRVLAPPARNGFIVQAGSFPSRAAAEEMRDRLIRRFPSLRIVSQASAGYRLVSASGTREQAEALQRDLAGAGIAGTFVTSAARKGR